MFARSLTAIAALSLLAASPAAAQSAASLSLAGSPALAEAGQGDASALRGRFAPFLIGGMVLAILIFVVVQQNEDNDLPNSP